MKKTSINIKYKGGIKDKPVSYKSVSAGYKKKSWFDYTCDACLWLTVLICFIAFIIIVYKSEQ